MIDVLKDLDKKGVDDNARKFTCAKIDAAFFAGRRVETYELITDWLVMDEASEEKIVSRDFGGGRVEYFHIKKVTENGSRKSKKNPISADDYQKILGGSKRQVPKRRSEFDLVQGNITFKAKYDEFRDGTCMLEIDAENDADRDAFDFSALPYGLEEVTGDIRYYGYRIAGVIAAPKN